MIETVGLEVQGLKDRIIRLEKKLQIANVELQQYLKDLMMWQTAHGSDYPLRRRDEILIKIEEMDKI